MGNMTIVTGLPGAPIGEVVRVLQANNLSARRLWESQPIADNYGEMLLQQGENPEITRIHETIFWNTHTHWCSEVAPVFYSCPFPGPDEVMAKFYPANVLAGDYRFCLFYPLWDRYISQVVICSIPVEQAINNVKDWIQVETDLGKLRKVFQNYERGLRNIQSRFKCTVIPWKTSFTNLVSMLPQIT